MLDISEEALKSVYYVNKICGVLSSGKFRTSHYSLLKPRNLEPEA